MRQYVVTTHERSASSEVVLPIPRRLRSLLATPSPLDWIRIGLLAAGVLCVVTGLLPAAEAEQNIRRILPLLLFLASVIVLANLARDALVFDVIATRLAITGRGQLRRAVPAVRRVRLGDDDPAEPRHDRGPDHPGLLALAARAGIAALPLAMTTIWLANTASLLLPVSNLTNLLAADRIALAAPAFAARMWAPQLASIAATMLFLWFFYWRRGRRGADRYTPPEPVRLRTTRERTLFRITGAACLLFVAAIPFIRDQIGVAAAGAAVIAVVAFAVLDRARLRLHLVPWQLLILVTGLFLVVPTLSRYGLSDVMTALIGTDPGPAGAYRAAAAGAGLSNVLNNLPAYTAGEAVVPPGDEQTLLALLIGTNVGPIVTPWASLATLLCLEACRRHRLRVSMRWFVLTGLGLAVTALLASVGALLVSGG